MNHKSSGFILLMTLLIILVLSALGLTCLNQVLLYHKALNSMEVQHERFYQLEHFALELARMSSSSVKECVIYKDIANGVIAQLRKQKGCLLSVSGDKYRYLIEDLGDFPCLKVHKSSHNEATHHIRVTVMSNNNSILQIRYLTPTHSQKCIGTVQFVTPGIKSWRLL